VQEPPSSHPFLGPSQRLTSGIPNAQTPAEKYANPPLAGRPRPNSENLNRPYQDTEPATPQPVANVAPPGWEGTVRKMKHESGVNNPFALAWWMKDRGYKSHK